ncbi:PREDICTED: F-box protein At5g49610-like isoform X2 [Ipomoea nil]|uniref:F-box protein At5g49610-like isoform X2 n=1 Tax=Ipomoea nil TaxID=35883 RepID=UPI00090116EF|nr:PREDICTED: F-box protein At5g49610-like isoform X2 [Ipomoea nil]XP_019154570.1 PREDICTED: F-box protein At5g49610-like isoform X2 [Ipomoea nil]
MDRGERLQNHPSASNSELLMDLKDIIREHALPFLPAKSLFRFKAVCRDWKLHISTPSFHHNQSLCCRNISGLFYQTSENCTVFVPIHPKSCGVPDPSLSFLPEPVVIRASSNGLLCCQGRNENGYYYLCNPVTKQWKKLPKPTACHGSEPAVVLIFEPSLLNFVPEYKLICAFPSAGFDGAAEFEIYTSKNNTWNVSGELRFGVPKYSLRSGVHVNGVVFWPVRTGCILSFDLTKDSSQLLDKESGDDDCLLGTFDERLCKVCYRLLNNEVFVPSVLVNICTNTMPLVWETKVVIDPKDTYMPLDDCDTKAVAVNRDIVVVESRKTFYSYDFEHKETKTLLSPPQPADSYYMRSVPYVNSLVSL